MHMEPIKKVVECVPRTVYLEAFHISMMSRNFDAPEILGKTCEAFTPQFQY